VAARSSADASPPALAPHRENSTLGITAVDGEGRVIGYAAFFDFPALTPEVDPTTWPEWLEETHGHPEFMVLSASAKTALLGA
jgi:hypothetical protein